MNKDFELPDDCEQRKQTVRVDCPSATACYVNTVELRKAAKCVFLATNETVAQDLADKLNGAANMIEALQDFALWMSGCGYDFCQHDYFRKKRDELLKA